MEESAKQLRRLYKSRSNRVIDGVCGGVAEYFDVDPTIVRILWVLLTLMGGSGFVLYIAGMILMPVRPPAAATNDAAPAARIPMDAKRLWGTVLVLLGLFLLFLNFGWIGEFGWWSFSGKYIFPVSLILLGVFFVYVQQSKSAKSPGAPAPAGPVPDGAASGPGTGAAAAQLPRRELRRSAADRKICGVCGGIARHFDVDQTIVRVAFVFIVFASFGWGILLYILLCLLMPEEKPTASQT